MRIAVAQIDPVVGSFEANVKKIREAYKRACSKDADLLLTPEMSICGYPPHDLLERPEMFERCEAALVELMAATKGQGCALSVGHVARTPTETGRAAQNVITVLEDGRRVFRQAKTLLPTYDVFDESRYFEPARESLIWTHGGKRIAMAICEDLWGHDPSFGRTLYSSTPVDSYAATGVDLVISTSSSPYEWGKRERREEVHADVARSLKSPLVLVNQIGANDEILFDGASFALDASGKMLGRLPVFKTSFGIFNVGSLSWESPAAEGREDEAPEEIESLYRGLVLGIREYFERTGHKKAIIGLSGGIDSALVATLAAQALGAANVLGVAMPSQYSSSGSLADAEALAKNLGLRFEVRPIKFSYSMLSRELSERRGELQPLAMENLQARLRGLTLMTLSNHDGALVLNTGNKSELATGYCTLHGDMVGALAPLGDVLKTRVYELSRYINQTYGSPIPTSSIEKAPSAELKPNQTDQDTLPKYEHLDAVLADYLERRVSVDELDKKYGKLDPGGAFRTGEKWVREVIQRVERNEYKRRQSALVLKTSPKAFGIGRRIPVAKKWEA
jgi:NAD+ synthetase